MEHFLKFVASLYGANVATNLLQTRICYFTFSPNELVLSTDEKHIDFRED